MDSVMPDWETQELSASEVAITNYNGEDINIVYVPSDIHSQRVLEVKSENGRPVFEYSDTIHTVIFPKSLNKISGCIFEGTSCIETLKVEDENEYFMSIDGVIFTTDKKTLVLFPPNRKGSYIIPAGVESIKDYAFAHSELEKIDFGETVKNVGEFAFLHSTITAANIHSAERISQSAFAECKNIKSFNTESSLTYVEIGDVIYDQNKTVLAFFPAGKTFDNNEFTLPETVTELAEYAFSNVKLINIRLSKRLISISDYTFKNASNFTAIIYGNVTTLGEQANSRRKENAKSAQLTAADIKCEIQSLRKLSEKAHASKMSLWESYRAGDVSKETFQNEGEKITKQAAMYTDKIFELEAKLNAIELSTGEENIIVERYIKQTGIIELTQSVVDEYIKEVIVYAPDRIEIVLNYVDDDEYLKIVNEDAV